MEQEDSTDMFSISKEDYGEDYDDKLFEQYKIYLKNIDSLENKRKITHNFFLSINTGLITVLGILSQFEIVFESNNQIGIIGGGIAGILFACSWVCTTKSYILLSTVKWDIILEIEKKLPMKIHEIEWKMLTNKKGRSKYLKLTDVELGIPIIFIVLYIFLIMMIIITQLPFILIPS